MVAEPEQVKLKRKRKRRLAETEVNQWPANKKPSASAALHTLASHSNPPRPADRSETVQNTERKHEAIVAIRVRNPQVCTVMLLESP